MDKRHKRRPWRVACGTRRVVTFQDAGRANETAYGLATQTGLTVWVGNRHLGELYAVSALRLFEEVKPLGHRDS